MSALVLVVNGLRCAVPADVALELARRVRASTETLERPLRAAAIYLEACCDSGAAAEIAFTDREEADLAWVLDVWAAEAGYAELPDAMAAIRAALRAQAA